MSNHLKLANGIFELLKSEGHLHEGEVGRGAEGRGRFVDKLFNYLSLVGGLKGIQKRLSGRDDKDEINIDRVPREVMESKLLVALDDDDKVALCLSEADLLLLIEASLWLNKFPFKDDVVDKKDRLEDLIDGMERLGQEAFG